MEKLLKEIIAKLDTMDTKINGMDTDIKEMKSDIKNIDQRLESVEGQQRETSDYVQALLHRSEELDAKFDGLMHNTASKDAVERIEAKVDILSYRIIAQDGEIQLMKKAK